MPNIGPLEIIIVLVIALVVLGPKRLPDFGRSVGKGLREFKGAISGDSHDDRDRDSHHGDRGLDRVEYRERELAERERRLEEREADLAQREA